MIPPDDDDPPRPRRRTPTLDDDEDDDASIALVDAIFDSGSEDAELADGPISPSAVRLAALAQQMAVDGRRRAVQARSTAGDGAVSDGSPLPDIERVPDTGEIRRMNRAEIERLVLWLQRRRGLTPTLTFEGIDDAELAQLARELRTA